MAQKKKLFLLDAMALIYRSYFAFSKNPRINSKGLNTSAVLGFANTLLEVLKKEQPTHIGVAFDTKAPTVRHIEFTEYKANRDKMPEDLSASIPYVIELIKGFNIPIIMLDGYEADDIIGTMAKNAEKEGFTTYMMTPDKDFGQLVSENIYMYKPARMGNSAEVWGVKEICERYSLRDPEQMIDLLGLWGDASDNIPGVPGIGEKTAIKLLQKYDSIEGLIENSSDLKGKQKENVENFSDQALLSKKLATIILDVPVEFNEDELLLQDPNEEFLKELFEELEFRNFGKRFFTKQSLDNVEENNAVQGDLFAQAEAEAEEKMIPTEIKTIENTEHNYILVETLEKAKDLSDFLQRQKSICFDTETTGLDANQAELVGISFAIKPHEAWYVSIPENYHDAQKFTSIFKPLFENEEIEKVGQNIKYDASILKWYDIDVKGKFFDTMLAHYLLQPDLRHNMDYMSETYLNYKPVSIETLIGKKGKNQKTMREADPLLVDEYAGEDADITLQLKEIFEPQLKETETLELFDKIEIPLVPVLASMEAEGVLLDTKTLKSFSADLETDINKVQKEIYEITGEEFNIASPKQLGIILFEKLKITDKAKKTKTGQYSTGEEVLVKLEKKHPIVSKILEFRGLSKLKSTYVDALPELVNPRDHRIHTSYNQAVAATGRLSSNNPNLQNIPIRTERGREIRKAFIPRNAEYTLLAADYSQVELRIIAHLSKDKGMMEAFNNGLDIHTATASKVYGIPLEEVDKDLRRNAKTVNFGLVYGISAFGLSERINIPRKEAKEIIDNYFIQYSGVKEYMDKSIAFARQHGYVETIMGRRRYLKDINSGNAIVRGFAERNAINAPIQGSSADMIKIAMIDIFQEMNRLKMKSKMILQVHDELVFDAHLDELDELKKIVQEKMKSAIKLDVPVIVDMNTGNNWLEAH